MTLPLVTGVAPRWESSLAELVEGSSRVQLVRRCADVPELVGVVEAGLAGVAVVSADFRGLDRDAVEALVRAGVLVVGLHPPQQEEAGRALRRWGVPVVLPADLSVAALDEAVAALLDGAGKGGAPIEPETADAGEDAGQGGRSDLLPPTPDRAGDPDDADDPDGLPVGEVDPVDEELRRLVEEEGGHDPGAEEGGRDPGGEDPQPQDEPGQVVVVWGPGGAGRTTVAVNLAAELADPLTPVLLLDADTCAASVAQHLAVLDEAPGLAAAARAADQGTLDADSLATLAPEVRPGLRLLSGLPRADRWPEIRESALADVIELCRRSARHVVVDVAPGVEQDEEISFDTFAPRRNGATLTALAAADRVLVVGAGDPVGLQRLVRGLDVLPQVSSAPCDVVVTRVRSGPVGPEPERRIREALYRFAGAQGVHLVPEDRESLDAALLHGCALVEVRPASAARASIRDLADRVAGREAGSRHHRARGRRRWWSRSRVR